MFKQSSANWPSQRIARTGRFSNAGCRAAVRAVPNWDSPDKFPTATARIRQTAAETLATELFLKASSLDDRDTARSIGKLYQSDGCGDSMPSTFRNNNGDKVNGEWRFAFRPEDALLRIKPLLGKGKPAFDFPC